MRTQFEKRKTVSLYCTFTFVTEKYNYEMYTYLSHNKKCNLENRLL